MVEDDAQAGRRTKAIILHDVEDVVHSAELRLFDTLIERHDLVQLPVLPLIDPRSRWVGGHYADEFAEAHGKDLLVRQALGAGLPSAGVGCAFARDALERIATGSGGLPFDTDSLTEDYELGLRLKAAGGSSAFVRMAAGPGRGVVVARGYFPATLTAAVNQKARWIAGIALSGWDRLGWDGGLAERWMRLRDRQSVLAALLMAAAYLALALWLGLALAGAGLAPLPRLLAILIAINTVLLAWRLAMRFGFVTRAYGLGEGLRSAPRMLVGNAIAMLAAWQAVGRYRRQRRTGHAQWGKTAHAFPAEVLAE